MALPAAADNGAEALLTRLPAPPEGAAWAAKARREAAERLRKMGAPGRRDEYWRFTDPAPLTAQAPPEAPDFRVDETPVFGEVDRLRVVFVDGLFSPELSDDLNMEGIEIELLSDAMSRDIHWARDVYGVLEAASHEKTDRPLAALNTATATDGVVIRVIGRPSRPVSLRYLRDGLSTDAVLHNVIKMEEGSELTLLETGPAAARFNKSMEVDLADGARFHHVRAQGRDHDRLAATHTFARLGAGSDFRSFTLTVNGVLTRNESVIEFTGDEATAHIAGACVGDGDFHHDDTVFVTHGAVACESRQVFKKVLRGGAKGIFQGKILVREGAQKTDGYQISQGLLLDETSQFLAKPELEIYADDVACSHGSTCGAVDDDMLFYLTSRGVPKAEAEDMLVLAFLDEAVAEIEDDELADDIRGRLNGWLSRRRD